MKIGIEQIQALAQTPNSYYDVFAADVLYHSNRMEGSTFTTQEIERLIAEDKVTGEHAFDDVVETRNSIRVLRHIVDTLGAPLTQDFIKGLNAGLLKGSSWDELGFVGGYKTRMNRIAGANIQLAYPDEVPAMVSDLLASWESSARTFEDICRFHARFEHIHPFQDGNGRTGRFIMLKQCIENDVDVIAIDDDLADPYRKWMEIALTDNLWEPFYEVMHKAQNAFEQRMTKAQFNKALAETA